MGDVDEVQEWFEVMLWHEHKDNGFAAPSPIGERMFPGMSSLGEPAVVVWSSLAASPAAT